MSARERLNYVHKITNYVTYDGTNLAKKNRSCNHWNEILTRSLCRSLLMCEVNFIVPIKTKKMPSSTDRDLSTIEPISATLECWLSSWSNTRKCSLSYHLLEVPRENHSPPLPNNAHHHLLLFKCIQSVFLTCPSAKKKSPSDAWVLHH